MIRVTGGVTCVHGLQHVTRLNSGGYRNTCFPNYIIKIGCYGNACGIRDAIFIGANLYVHVRNSAHSTMNSSNEPSTSAEADIPGAVTRIMNLRNSRLRSCDFCLQCRGAHGLSKLKTKADCVRL